MNEITLKLQPLSLRTSKPHSSFAPKCVHVGVYICVRVCVSLEHFKCSDYCVSGNTFHIFVLAPFR